jgi:hypothetical protein
MAAALHASSRIASSLLDQVAEFTPTFGQGSTRVGTCLSEERGDPEVEPDWLEGTSIGRLV